MSVSASHLMLQCKARRPACHHRVFCMETPYKHGSKQYETCENPLVEFICKDFQPVNIVESVGFLNHSKTLDPLYQPVLRTHFLRIAIPSKYKKVNDMMMMLVNTVLLLQICGQDVGTA